ncbi:type III-A CRISPR-associated protein Cas10/Csm1 [Clostridium sp. AF34-13]|uniref:type III-A CRISPR-associated protein Cas10/Csm1 n=1 Tax=Clostridium sp. AF34-13 TaxID=2293012 RepID=UPI000E46B1BB|nr:type III-A CRISPR-associated protein Cas10/Csm1 [Clostridium sp. AF34-13]RHP28149.1 type III-A CRISPR-associated protein Cas10/Csm1 [Clostridium sp. AF34-13]
MTEENVKLAIGALLHDIGKLLYRYNDGRNHSRSGYEYLKDVVHIEDREILEQVLYHHASLLKNARIENNSLAYITYIADNIASASDRRKTQEEEPGFDREMSLQSIFNLLNCNDEKLCYSPEQLNENINYPTSVSTGFDEIFYGKIVNEIEKNLRGITWNKNYLNSLLEVLEAQLSYIPSSTMKSEVADISLYDHVKITAAIAASIKEWLDENNISDYKETLFKGATGFYGKKVFLLFSMDMSGIQDFIYTIASKNALKMLRSRSFYLEIFMENLIDELLDYIGMSRSNLIYSGGGHAYIITANTENIKQKIVEFELKINEWLLDEFKTALFLGCGYAECSANELHNEPEGTYRQIFKNVSKMISQKKMKRYSAAQIIKLNSKGKKDGTRECRVCRRASKLLEDDDICSVCNAMIDMSQNILYEGFYIVTENPKDKVALPLPFGRYLVAYNKEELLEKMKQDDSSYIRAYTKNKSYTGFKVVKKLWVGDYTLGDSFEKLAKKSEGINRIAVFRADVDNLADAFVNGFVSEKYGEKYMTISRTATFSRKMSMFFKYHINYILKNGEFYIVDKKKEDKGKKRNRNATIVYSGGDDVFVVGSWDDVVGFAVDLQKSLKEFSQDTLTISGGIGIYPAKYPINNMARLTGELEECSKNYKELEKKIGLCKDCNKSGNCSRECEKKSKNAITLFTPPQEKSGNNSLSLTQDMTFSWKDFENNVVKIKLNFLKKFFVKTPEKGKAFLYRILELIRGMEDDKINLARLAYTLARLEEALKKDKEAGQIKEINFFSSTIYKWIGCEKDRKEFIAAIYLYVYLIRDEY